MKSFYYTLSSVALSVAIFALAAPASAQGRRPGGASSNDRPRQSMQQHAPSSSRPDRSMAAPQTRPSAPSNRSTATPQARPSAPSNRSTSTPQTRPSTPTNRPSYSPSGDNNRPRGGGNHGGGNNGGGRNFGGDNKGYQNQRPNATPGRPENRNYNDNTRTYQPGSQVNRGSNQRPGSITPGNGNNRPGGNNGNGNTRPGGGNDRPSGNMNPGGNNGGNHGGGNHGNNGNNYRPGNDNHRPGSGHGGNHGGNYRPDNNRPDGHGGNHGGNYRPGNNHRPGGPHHGGINHGGPRPDYNRYRWHSDVRPRGPRDRWYDYYRYNRWSWHAPIAPPYRQWRPRIVWYYRPIIPTGYRYYVSAPIISGVLGLEFGTYLDASLNYLYYNGYDIDGYQDNVVYLRDVNMMGYSWPDVMLQYDSNGGMYYAEFVTSTSYQDDYRFRSLYNSLCTTFGTPINSGNGHFSWYGRDGSGFVNLNTMYDGGRFFTVLTFGV